MCPYIHLGALKLSTYYLMMLVGFLAMGYLMLHRRERYGLNALQACLFTVCVMFSGVLGCKLLYMLENLGEPFTFGGFSFFGAVFLVPPLIALFGLPFGMKPAASVNASAPCVNAMIGTIRFGCFLNGCCGGWTTAGGFIWPTQAMESFGDFAILIWLLSREKKDDIKLYPEFMLCYSVLRFLIEFLRDTPKDWLSLSHGQWFSIAAAAIAVIMLLSGKKRGMEK